MKLTTGQTLASAVDATTVVVVRAPQEDVALTCGGAPLVDPRAGDVPSGVADPAQMTGSVLGKRYADEASGLELLCTKGGEAGLFLDGVAIPVKGAKPLPASD